MTGQKEMLELRRIVISQGWTYTQCSGAHEKWYPPEGEFILVSRNFYGNMVKKVKSQLRKKGVVL